MVRCRYAGQPLWMREKQAKDGISDSGSGDAGKGVHVALIV
jgi:hypothetical protein